MANIPEGNYSPEDGERFLSTLAVYKGMFYKTCRALRLKAGMVRGWMERYPAFQEAVQRIMDEESEEFMDECEDLIRKKAPKNAKVAMFALTNHPKGKARGWGKRTEVAGKVALESWTDMMAGVDNPAIGGDRG